MIIAVTRPQRADADVSDLTGKEILRRGYETDAAGEEQFVIQFATNLTANEEAAVRRRLSTGSPIEETLQARAVAAYQDLQAFEGQANVTNADVVRIVKLLCKVTRGLIRLQLRQLDSTD